MKHGWWSLVLMLGLCGCFQDSGNSGPPDLKLADVVGCWTNLADTCIAQCFARDRGFFDALQGLGPSDSREDSGSFTLNGYALTEVRKYASPQGYLGSDTGVAFYQIKDGVLVGLYSNGSPTSIHWSRSSPDSFPCGIKPWRVFNKPAGWDSLVQPLP